MEKKTVWFSAFRRVVPADYELWLESLAAQGWNIDKIHQTSSMRMTFVKTEPKQYRYVFDLNAFPRKDYFNTYEQFGWECLGHMASCYIWRKEYTGERPESFSDRESVVRRNKRIKTVLQICMALMFVSLAALFVGIGFEVWTGDYLDVIEMVCTVVLVAGVGAYLGWVIKKLNQNMER